MAITQFKIYQSTDAGAPTLTGQAGSFLSILNAVLVNGYGSKAPAGWSKPFADVSNTGSFRQGGGNRIYMDVADNATGGSYGPNVQEAAFFGYEAMTAPGTGTGKFSYTTASLYQKSVSADGTARRWLCFADDATLYFFGMNGQNNDIAPYWNCCQFGEFYSYVTNDQCRNYIGSRNASGGTVIGPEATYGASYVNAATVGYALQRAWGGSGPTGVSMGVHCDAAKGGSNIYVQGGMAGAVSLSDNTQWFSPVYIHESATATIRGRKKGWWQFCHDNSKISCGQVIQGNNELAGRQFVVVSPVGGGWTAALIEISNTVERN